MCYWQKLDWICVPRSWRINTECRDKQENLLRRRDIIGLPSQSTGGARLHLSLRALSFMGFFRAVIAPSSDWFLASWLVMSYLAILGSYSGLPVFFACPALTIRRWCNLASSSCFASLSCFEMTIPMTFSLIPPLLWLIISRQLNKISQMTLELLIPFWPDSWWSI